MRPTGYCEVMICCNHCLLWGHDVLSIALLVFEKMIKMWPHTLPAECFFLTLSIVHFFMIVHSFRSERINCATKWLIRGFNIFRVRVPMIKMLMRWSVSSLCYVQEQCLYNTLARDRFILLILIWGTICIVVHDVYLFMYTFLCVLLVIAFFCSSTWTPRRRQPRLVKPTPLVGA
jgi:hypothetical protein